MEHDYTRRDGVVSTELIVPDGGPVDRGQLWNAAEAAENRKDARTAREWVVALPAELDAGERAALARSFGVELVQRYGVAVDLAIHSPDREGDNRNHHAHLLTTTRRLGRDEQGRVVLHEKATIEQSDTKRREAGLGSGADEVTACRELWATMTNAALAKAKRVERVSHRSLKDQGIDRMPTTHLGPVASEMERRGVASDQGDANRQIETDNAERERLTTAVVVELDQVRLERMDDAQLKREYDRRAWEPFERIAERHPKIAPTFALAERAFKGVMWCEDRLKAIGVRWEKHMAGRHAAGGLMTSVQRLALRHVGATFGAVKASQEWLAQQTRMKARTERVMDLRHAQIRKLGVEIQDMAEQLRPEIEAGQADQILNQRRVLIEIEQRKTREAERVRARKEHVNSPEMMKAVYEIQKTLGNDGGRGGGRRGGRSR